MNKRYFEKLNVEKLAELKKQNELQKVELSLMADFNKLFEDAKKQDNLAEGKGLQNLRKVVLDVESDFLKLSRIVGEALEMAEKIEKSAKDLGIDLGNEVKGKVNVLKSCDQASEYWVKELNADQYR